MWRSLLTKWHKKCLNGLILKRLQEIPVSIEPWFQLLARFTLQNINSNRCITISKIAYQSTLSETLKRNENLHGSSCFHKDVDDLEIKSDRVRWGIHNNSICRYCRCNNHTQMTIHHASLYRLSVQPPLPLSGLCLRNKILENAQTEKLIFES